MTRAQIKVEEAYVSLLRMTPSSLLIKGMVSDESIRAICGLGRSSKDPRKTIGYKGLGFKSVGEISNNPQVISSAVSFGFDEIATRLSVEEVIGESLDSAQRLPVYAFPFSGFGIRPRKR